MIKCTLIDNETGRIISKDFNIEIDDIQKNQISKAKKLKGVYKITYLPTNQVYIGSSKYIQRRWKEHKRDLLNNDHHSRKLQKTWNEVNDESKFKFEILEIVDEIHLLFKREQYWINYYDAASDENFNMLKDAGAVFLKSDRDKFNDMQKQVCGNFVFFNIEKMKELNEILTESDIVKFFLIGTYINNDNVLVLDNNTTLIKKARLKQILDMNDNRHFKKFYNKLIENNLLYEKDKNLHINNDYFFKGKSKRNNHMQNITRVYVEQIRNLYKDIGINSQRLLSLIFKLLPYMHYKYNILCSNTEEKIKENINVIKLSQIATEIQRDVTQINRAFKGLSSIKIDNEDIIKIIKSDDIIKKPHLIINPRLFYRYNNTEEMQSLLNIFEVTNKL